MELTPRRFRPSGYTIAASIISVGGLLNGYDTGCIGAVTTMPYFETTFGVLSPTIRGFTVSLIMLMGAVPSFFSGQLADRFGHLHIVMAGALVFTLGAILQASASQLSMFLVGRALAGIGEGLWLTNVSVYITEISPAARRGTLVSLPQFMATIGVCTGYFTCYGSIHIDSSFAWRLPFIIMGVLAVILAGSCIYLPKSPRWLQINGRRGEALRVVERLGISSAEAEKDIFAPSVENAPPKPGMTLRDFSVIFNKQYRIRTSLGIFILGMVQLCGIDGVLYYAPTLFTQAGLPAGTASFLASGLSAILMLAISIPASLYADHWGRRTSVITGGIGLSACMFVIGSLYAADGVHANTGAGRWFVIVLIFCFALLYVSTWGIVAKIYASEVQPAKTRAAANSLAQGLNFFTNWLVAFATPIFLAHSSYGTYFLFGGLSLFTVVVLAMFMPETRGQSLESIQDAFHAPHWAWQMRSIVSSLG
ncbi:hypothetical protein MMC26_004224 [Xylographa opegraphella]|nr:hypothetical protein [Xylographa opegraphella]